MRKAIQKYIRNLCNKHEKLYVLCYLGSFFLMIAAGSYIPFTMKSLVYPVFFEKRSETGIIEEIKQDEIEIWIPSKYRAAQYQKYYFIIDGMEVPVSGKDYYIYETGDSYSYFRYEGNEKEIGDHIDYQLWQGIIGALIQTGIFVTALIFIFTDTGEKELKKREEQDKDEKLPEKLKYKEYSTKELYELCVSKKVHIIPGKRKNRKYLEHCLMQEYEYEVYHYEHAKEDSKVIKLLHLIGWIGCGYVLIELMRHAYYITYLFQG